jgi:hypothetical protein
MNLKNIAKNEQEMETKIMIAKEEQANKNSKKE